ncbi:MAG: Mur ligase domain-containing protein, partial [Ferruginibacter sp.]
MILQDILYKVSIRSVKGNTNIEVNGLHIDSRNVKSSSCFIALKGTKTDGEGFITSAIEKGATAIICEALPPVINEAVTYVQVDSAAEAAGYMSHNFYGEPSLKLKLVGVTGT